MYLNTSSLVFSSFLYLVKTFVHDEIYAACFLLRTCFCAYFPTIVKAYRRSLQIPPLRPSTVPPSSPPPLPPLPPPSLHKSLLSHTLSFPFVSLSLSLHVFLFPLPSFSSRPDARLLTGRTCQGLWRLSPEYPERGGGRGSTLSLSSGLTIHSSSSIPFFADYLIFTATD